MSKPRPFRLEQLEDRCVPATYGNPWPDASHLTISFVPDGTSLGNGQSSVLFQTLNSTAATKTWETTILKAFQTWAVNSDINLGLVNDDGQAFGSAGAAQANNAVGDIRIAAAPLSSNLVAISDPYDPTDGTWSGEVILNSNDFGTNASANYDLFSVALHEAGHIFGLPDNTDPTSVMYQSYQGVYTSLSASDVSALQGIYGTRTTDSNGSTFANATQLSLLGNVNGVLSVGVNGELSSVGGDDMYRFTAPSVTGGLQIQLQDAGYSLFTGQLTVYNSRGQVVGTAQSTDPTSDNVALQLNSVTPLGTYYVKVQGASGTAFDVSSYNLNIQSIPVVNKLVGGLLGVVNSVGQSLSQSVELNTSFQTAQQLSLKGNGNGSHYHVAHQAKLNSPSVSDYYTVQAPAASTGDNVLTVTVWGTGSGGLVPNATIYDSNQNAVAYQVLSNEGGTETIQVTGATPGATYYIKVGAAAGSPASTGSYTVAADFGATAVQLDTDVDSTLNAQTTQASDTLAVQKTSLFHFVLSADQNNGTGVELTITNSSGQVVQQITAAAGAAISTTLMLSPDNYTFTFTPLAPAGTSPSAVNYLLQGTVEDDQMGTQPMDTSSAPSQSPPPPTTTQSPSPTTTSGSTTTTNSSSPPSYTTNPSTYTWYYGPGTQPPASQPSTV